VNKLTELEIMVDDQVELYPVLPIY